MSVRFDVLADYSVKRKKLTSTWTNKAVEHEGDGDINCSWCAWNGPNRLGEWTGGNKRKNHAHLDYNVALIDRNTQKSTDVNVYGNPADFHKKIVNVCAEKKSAREAVILVSVFCIY